MCTVRVIVLSFSLRTVKLKLGPATGVTAAGYPVGEVVNELQINSYTACVVPLACAASSSVHRIRERLSSIDTAGLIK